MGDSREELLSKGKMRIEVVGEVGGGALDGAISLERGGGQGIISCVAVGEEITF